MNHKDIAKQYGIAIDYDGDPKKLCNWDGFKINAKDITEDGMIHEIAHWILAPEERRAIPDYGLGAGPSSSWDAYNGALKKMGKEPRDFNHIKDVDEEILTCVLEFCFEGLIGMDMIHLMRDRNFLEFSTLKWESDDVMIHIKELQRRGVIDRFWVPKEIKKIITKEHRANLTKFRQLVRSIS
jgi:hypothetical protein